MAKKRTSGARSSRSTSRQNIGLKGQRKRKRQHQKARSDQPKKIARAQSRSRAKSADDRSHRRRRGQDERILPCVGWLRRRGTAVWIEPDPWGKPALVRDGSDAGCETGDAVRFRAHAADAPIISGADATIVERIGEENDATLLSMAIANLGLPMDFTQEVLAGADEFADVDPETALAGHDRHDLRSLPHVTIDGEDARDFDDAVSATQEEGCYRVWVSIADVSWYVKPRSAIDKEAGRRGTSVYLPARVLPMLPERLSNDLCSLRPGVPRLTVTCEMVVDETGRRHEISVYPSIIQSAARLTYRQVQGVLDGDRKAVPEASLHTVHQTVAASHLLRRRRFSRGSLDLNIPEAAVVMDDNGVPVDVQARRPTRAHHVIEDLMIAANESVAEYLLEHKLAGLYRVHPPPPREKWESMKTWGKRFGLSLKLGDIDKPKTVAHFIDALKQTPRSDAGQLLLLRALAQAYYDHRVGMHYGLASKAYAHFTSPIRRYPDLLVHRALWSHWRGKSRLRGLEEMAESSSVAERRALQGERDITHLSACMVARRKVGEEMVAKIVGVHSAGLFVRPDDLFAEGLIPFGVMGKTLEEGFEVFQDEQIVVGRRSKRTYGLGDALMVRLASVDLPRRRINFGLVDPAGDEFAPTGDSVDQVPGKRSRKSGGMKGRTKGARKKSGRGQKRSRSKRRR